MTTWLTSDQHYGHTNIISYSGRPFTGLEEMHCELVSRHNAVVKPNDDVWHLGDFALDERLVGKFLPQLNGRHRLVMGNHDKCHPCRKRSASFRKKYYTYGFMELHEKAELGQFLLCHMPYVSKDQRYPEYRPKDEGKWLLHGHVHELWAVKDKMINVGVDQWNFTPVALEELEWIANGNKVR